MRVETRGRLKELQRLVDFATLTLDERLDVDRILRHAATVLELLLNRLEAFIVPARAWATGCERTHSSSEGIFCGHALLADVLEMDEPVSLVTPDGCHSHRE